MIEIKILSNKEAKNRFCNNEKGSKDIISELTKRALDKGLSIITMEQSSEYTSEDMKSVKKYTFSQGYKTIFAIGLGTTKREIVLACEKN